jgi:hypothetical protein
MRLPLLLLLTLDSTLRRSGGGEIARVGEAVRFIAPGAILNACLIEDVVTVSSRIMVSRCWVR